MIRISRMSKSNVNIPRFYLKSPINWWRWSSIVIMGLGTQLFIDFIYGLFYQASKPRFQPLDYLIALIISFIILEGVRWINRQLERKLPWVENISRRFLAQLISNTLFVVLTVAGLKFIFDNILGKANVRPMFDDAVVITTTFSITVLVVSIEMGIYFLHRWRKSMIELERFKKSSLEFRHEMLKTQVNPHFLFNSLNTLSSLVHSDPETAYQFIRQLASVYRNVLEHRNKGLVTLAEELKATTSYVDLMRLRFGDKLHLHFYISAEKNLHQVPPLMLQLLIENAIKHNVVSEKYPLSMWIGLEQDNIVIKNSLRLKTSKGYSSKIGLDNICSHYDIVTDKKVVIEQTEKYFTVKIPLLEPDYEGIDY
ncbi:MAG: histidine kinase [Reichenbachiella sp.]|uniref:sensor histidine kinase n=1 Tax=Reichenbachiella sp. TaxID=2184521 RepID=UPI003263698B